MWGWGTGSIYCRYHGRPQVVTLTYLTKQKLKALQFFAMHKLQAFIIQHDNKPGHN